MNGKPDPKLALSQVEADALKAMRTRLNKTATSDAAAATLGRAFFQVAARSGLEAAADPAGLKVMGATLGRGGAAVVKATRAAGMANLNLLMAVLHARLVADPAAWRALATAGAPQAIIGRRLQLAGREPDLSPDLSEDPGDATA